MILLNDLIQTLGLTKPVTLTIKTRKGKDCDAYYLPLYSDRTGKLIGHKITIYTKKTTRDFETLLAHELIHAWQEEQKKQEIHGKHFRKIAEQLELEFGLTEIFIKGIDK